MQNTFEPDKLANCKWFYTMHFSIPKRIWKMFICKGKNKTSSKQNKLPQEKTARYATSKDNFK